MAEPGTRPIRIEGLSSKHDRPSFSCGDEALDTYFRTQANQAQQKDLSRTFVLVEVPGDDVRSQVPVLGYYTLTVSQLEFDIIPKRFTKRLPQYPVSAIHIARLAVSRELHGHGYGTMLLGDAVRRAVRICDDVGVPLIDVFAKNERVRLWYQARGLVAVGSDPNHLIMSMQSARRIVRETGQP